MMVLNLETRESGLVATASQACERIGERVLATIDIDSEDGYDHVFSESNMYECTQSYDELELEAPANQED